MANPKKLAIHSCSEGHPIPQLLHGVLLRHHALSSDSSDTSYRGLRLLFHGVTHISFTLDRSLVHALKKLLQPHQVIIFPFYFNYSIIYILHDQSFSCFVERKSKPVSLFVESVQLPLTIEKMSFYRKGPL